MISSQIYYIRTFKTRVFSKKSHFEAEKPDLRLRAIQKLPTATDLCAQGLAHHNYFSIITNHPQPNPTTHNTESSFGYILLYLSVH